MNQVITKRSELLFCYDIVDANPNGDPLDENKPRVDEETKQNIVTDVRLKRTIRDYLFEYEGYNALNGKDIFVRPTEYEKGGLKDAKERSKDFSEDFNKKKDDILNNILNKCIDIRLFGGVLPLEKGSITFTGPVQFQMGRSLHRVEMKHIKGTGAFASSAGKNQQTFREEYVLPYSFICFHGIINELAAKETKLQEEDVELLLKAMWKGTKNLISRSKFGQMPRLLFKIDYSKEGFFIGDLNKLIKIKSNIVDEKLRDVKDFTLDIEDLKNKVNEYKDNIENIYYKVDDRLILSPPINMLLENKIQEINI